MATQIEAIINKPFVRYDTAVVDIPSVILPAIRSLEIQFNFIKVLDVENDNCVKVSFNCDQKLPSVDVDTWELMWEHCAEVDILSTPVVVTDAGNIVSVTFTMLFAHLQDKNYFRLWGVKTAKKFLISKGVIFARL